MMKETDRVRFEKKALENNATIAISEPTILKVIAVNGKLITTYFFNEDGSYKSNTHKFL